MATRPARILGCGVLSGAGRGVEAFWRALLTASPGQGAHDLGDPILPAAYVAIPEPRDGGGDDLATAWLALACEEALAAAAPSLERLGPPARMGLFAGSSLGGMTLLERRQRRSWDAEGARGDGIEAPELPLWRSLYDGPAAALAARLGLAAGGWTLNTACSSAANALGLARRWLLRGRVDVALVAGYDVVSPFVYAGFQALGALDPEPTAPFCRNRRGLNLGEAAVAFVLARTADGEPAPPRPIDIVGYGSSCDAHHLTRPDLGGHGLARALAAALADAGLKPEQVGVVSAHATGTPYNDAMEAAAFARVFGTSRPWVHCAKPVLGHTLGAAGAVDALAMALALTHERLPRTYLGGEPDLELGFLPSAEERSLAPDTVAVSSSSGFGGSNAVLVLRRGDV